MFRAHKCTHFWLVVLDYNDGKLPLDLGMRPMTEEDAALEARILNVYHQNYDC